MTVLIVPEDFRKDQFLLKPLFSKLFATLGKPRAKILICQDPLLGGVDEALKSERIAEIVERYGGRVRIIVLCIDRDGKPGRPERLKRLEEHFGERFLGVVAWEEIEAWALAGLKLPAAWNWTDVRAEVHVKEQYFDVLAEERGLDGDPDGGRKRLGEEAARRIATIRQKCPDFDALAKRLEAILSADN